VLCRVGPKARAASVWRRSPGRRDPCEPSAATAAARAPQRRPRPLARSWPRTAARSAGGAPGGQGSVWRYAAIDVAPYRWAEPHALTARPALAPPPSAPPSRRARARPSPGWKLNITTPDNGSESVNRDSAELAATAGARRRRSKVGQNPQRPRRKRLQLTIVEERRRPRQHRPGLPPAATPTAPSPPTSSTAPARHRSSAMTPRAHPGLAHSGRQGQVGSTRQRLRQ
jgi:hypothetical protein